jgi:hypothetical protein
VMFDKFLIDCHQIDYLERDFELNRLVTLVNKIDSVNTMEMLDYMKDWLVNNMVMLNLV